VRGRLVNAFLAEITRLDTVATAADPDGAGPLASGYDPDFKETVVLGDAGDRRDARRRRSSSRARLRSARSRRCGSSPRETRPTRA
jgi:hypothetical protein